MRHYCYTIMSIAINLLLFSFAYGYQPGDIDGDGKIGIADSIASLQIAAGLSPAITSPTVRTIVVSPDPGNADQSGQNLLAAITEASGASANDQWLIVIEPGLYFIDDVTCVVPAFVHLEGAGPDISIIRSSAIYAMELNGTSQIGGLSVDRISGNQSNGYGILVKDGLPTIRNVKVSVVASNQAVGIWANILDKLVLKDVHVDAAGNAFSKGILLQSTDAELFDVNVQVHGRVNNSGIDMYSYNGSTPKVVIQHGNIQVWDDLYPNDGSQQGISAANGKMTIKDSFIEVNGGMYAYGLNCSTDADVLVYNSEFAAQWASQYNYGVFNNNSARMQINSSLISAMPATGASAWAVFNANQGGYIFIGQSDISGKVRNDSGNTIWISSSKFRSGVGSVSGSVTCAGVWDQGYTFYASTCP